ncbi:MAG: hypothetical protein MR473_02320 [Clostridiales bacterium]|nr:hypothetical protein [Clostridiales bacterium]
MCSVPGARLSPEIAAGELRFCQGDTFTVTFVLELADQDGTPVPVAEEDVVTLDIFDWRHQLVERMTYAGVTEGRIALVMTEELSERLPAGAYTYRIAVTHGGSRTTVAWENKMIVR